MKLPVLTTGLLFCFVIHSQAQNVFPASGAVGIGTASPAYPLHVTGASKFQGLAYFGDGTDNSTYGKGIQIIRHADQGDNAFHLSFVREGNFVAGLGFLRNSNVFGIQAGGDITSPYGIFLTTNGNVGIGVSAPSDKLTVAGNIALTGTGAYIGIALTDHMTYDGQYQPHYGMQYTMDSWTTAGPTMWVSSYGGIKLFTTGAPRLAINADGNVGIGTITPGGYKLAVEGTIGARRVKVTTAAWADFVFDEDYQLPSLGQVEAFVKANKHLPDVPSAAEVKKDGQDLGEMNKILLQKIEELTLHLIEQEKRIKALEQGGK